MQRRFEELNEANDNLRNLFEVTEIATVILDRDLLIRSFTPAIRGIFNLKDIDRGRPLTDIVSGIVDLDLQAGNRSRCSPTGQSRSRRVVSRDGRAHYLMRVLPYLTVERTIDGVLVTFTDMTRIAEAEARLEELRRRIDAMLRFVLDMAERSLPHEAASVALRGRLRALADTYRLVSEADWEPVPLAELVGRELADFGTGREGRVVADGAPVLVRADTAVTLGMALHELAARAAAEGALSVPQGRVHLDWADRAGGRGRAEAGDPLARIRRTRRARRRGGGARELIERGLSRTDRSQLVGIAGGGWAHGRDRVAAGERPRTIAGPGGQVNPGCSSVGRGARRPIRRRARTGRAGKDIHRHASGGRTVAKSPGGTG